jgi:hypothetical protein
MPQLKIGTFFPEPDKNLFDKISPTQRLQHIISALQQSSGQFHPVLPEEVDRSFIGVQCVSLPRGKTDEALLDAQLSQALHRNGIL